MKPATVLAYDGIEQSITEWALDYGITPAIIIGRLERGASTAEAITTPMKTHFAGQRLPVFSRKQLGPNYAADKRPTGSAAKAYSFDGQTLTVPQWARIVGLKAGTIGARLRSGWTIEEALSTPLDTRGGKAGVSSNFTPLEGTGAGSTAQETPEIDFSNPHLDDLPCDTSQIDTLNNVEVMVQK